MVMTAREDTLEQIGILTFLVLPGNWFPASSAFSTLLFVNSLLVCGFAQYFDGKGAFWHH